MRRRYGEDKVQRAIGMDDVMKKFNPFNGLART